MRMEDPRQLDVGCDDKVLLTLQYSTHWDAFCHMGQMFDADGDGVDEIRYYNGWRGGIDVGGPVDYAIATGTALPRPAELGPSRLGTEHTHLQARRGGYGRASKGGTRWAT